MNYNKKIRISLSVMELNILSKYLNDNVVASDTNQTSINEIKNKLALKLLKVWR